MSKLFNTLSDVLTPYANKINLHSEEISEVNESLQALEIKSDNTLSIMNDAKTEIDGITYTNQYIQTNGSIKNNDAYKLSSYIPTYGYKIRAENSNSNTALYIVEFNSSKEILRRHYQYNATSIETEGDCDFVRFYAYKSGGDIDTDKLSAYWINDNSINSRFDEIDERKFQVNNIMPNTAMLRHVDAISVGAEINNDSSNTTYIYNMFVTKAVVSEGQTVTLQIDDVQNNTQENCVYCYFYDSSDVLIQQKSFEITPLRNGIKLHIPSGVSKFSVGLYPSVTGGLTTEPAIYKNVNVILSNSSASAICYKYTETSYPAPAYYMVNDYLDSKISVISNYMEDAEGSFDSFIFITDLHWSLNTRNSPALIEYISKRLPMPRMFVGGDIEDGINLDANNMLKRAFGGKIYNINGNHEYMNSIVVDGIRDSNFEVTGSTIWTYNHQHMTDCMVGDAKRGYYYVDNVVQKIRYIILNDFDDGPVLAWETTQITWLQAVLSAMQSGWTAIIFVHAVSSVNRTTGALEKNYIFNNLETIVDGYAGSGEIGAIIAGHTHFDGLGATTGGVPVFITTCDKYGVYGEDDTFLAEKRVKNTITEQAFDVFVVDKNNKKVSAIRIGCPADNPTGSPLEIRTANY